MSLPNEPYRILMIEDDSDLTVMYKTKLEADGFNVSVATNGKAGLQAIKEKKPDLVLLDILIPKKDGFEVLEEKNKWKDQELKDIPVIVLTNLSSPIDIEYGEELGVKEWLVKADNMPSEVSQKVRQFFNKKT